MRARIPEKDPLVSLGPSRGNWPYSHNQPTTLVECKLYWMVRFRNLLYLKGIKITQYSYDIHLLCRVWHAIIFMHERKECQKRVVYRGLVHKKTCLKSKTNSNILSGNKFFSSHFTNNNF